jgi:hypothetical protein
LHQVVAGAGYQVSPAFSVGASANLLFGVIDHLRRVQFDDPLGYIPTQVNESTRLSGLTGTVGARFAAGGLLGENDHLSLGAAVMLPARLRGRQMQTMGITADRDTLGAVDSGNFALPVLGSIGATYSPDSRWLAALDVRYEPWSAFSSDLPLVGYIPEEGGLSDRLRVGGGLEFVPAGADPTRSYFARSAYRAGFYVDNGYVSPSDNVNLTSYALTGGLSLPTLLAGTRIDLNFEVGTRGTTDADLVRDLFYRLTATFNIGERWFVIRRLG